MTTEFDDECDVCRGTDYPESERVTICKRHYDAIRDCGCSDTVERTGQRMLALEVAAKDIWPLVDEVRAIVVDHYPDGSRHDDPEYERRRSVTAALVRQALDLRTVLDEPSESNSGGDT